MHCRKSMEKFLSVIIPIDRALRSEEGDLFS